MSASASYGHALWVYVREVPKGDLSRSAKSLLDHLVGKREQRRRHVEAERLGCLEVDHQFELGLDLAESELGILSSQCLDRRIPDKHTLISEIAAWEHDRNANHTKANWHFTTPNARVKLKHLYPSI